MLRPVNLAFLQQLEIAIGIDNVVKTVTLEQLSNCPA